MLETVYEVTLAHRLMKHGLSVERQIPIAIKFDEQQFDIGFRVDLFVEEKVIIELKSLETIHPVHKKQLLTYLRLSETKLGYLLNFGDALMKDGITRIIHGQL